MTVPLSNIELPETRSLTNAETRKYLQQAQAGDTAARRILIEHNLRLVMSVVQRFRGRGDLEDLFQIGCLGLAKAIDGFDLSYDVRFSTYAVPVIIGEIKRYLRDDQTIRVSRSLQELAQRAVRKKAELEQKLNRAPTLKELAVALEVEPEELVASMEAVQAPESLQSVIYEDEGQPILLEDQIGTASGADKWIESIALREVYATLTPEEQQLITLRFLEEKTQVEVAKQLGISQAQVSRLEKKLLKNMRAKLE